MKKIVIIFILCFCVNSSYAANFNAYDNLTDSQISGTDELGVWDTSESKFQNILVSEFMDYITGELADDFADYLPISGGTLTGYLTLHAVPTADLHASTKKYVDDSVASVAAYDESNVNITGGAISGVTLSLGSLSGNGVKGTLYGVTAGENISAYQVVAMRNDGGTAKAYKYSCDTGDANKTLIAVGIASAAITSGEAGHVVLLGLVRNSGWSLTAADTGKVVYASTTDGGLTVTAPSVTGDVIQAIGSVVDGGNEIVDVRPSKDYGVVQ